MKTKEMTQLYRDHGLDASNIGSKSDVVYEAKVAVTELLYHKHGVGSADIAAFERHMFGATTHRTTIRYRLGMLTRNEELP